MANISCAGQQMIMRGLHPETTTDHFSPLLPCSYNQQLPSTNSEQNRLLTGIFNGFILIFSKTSFTMHITSGKISCAHYLGYIMQDMVEVSVSACLHPVNWPCLSCVHRWSLVSWRSPVLHFVCFVFLLGGKYQIKNN